MKGDIEIFSALFVVKRYLKHTELPRREIHSVHYGICKKKEPTVVRGSYVVEEE